MCERCGAVDECPHDADEAADEDQGAASPSMCAIEGAGNVSATPAAGVRSATPAHGASPRSSALFRSCATLTVPPSLHPGGLATVVDSLDTSTTLASSPAQDSPHDQAIAASSRHDAIPHEHLDMDNAGQRDNASTTPLELASASGFPGLSSASFEDNAALPRSVWAPPPNATSCSSITEGSSYEMVSTSAQIPPRTEVMNTYGARLTNGALLAQYGFALEANENDCIVFTWDEACAGVRAPAGGSRCPASAPGSREATGPAFQTLYAAVAREWEASTPATVWNGSGLVYADVGGRGGRRYGGWGDGGWTGRLNADGRICEGLWLFCAVAALTVMGGGGTDINIHKLEGGRPAGVGCDVSDAGCSLGAVAALQLALEGAEDGSSDAANGDAAACAGQRLDDGTQDPDWARRVTRTPDPAGVVCEIVRTVVDLCDSRRKAIGKGDLAATDALDVRRSLLSLLRLLTGGRRHRWLIRAPDWR